MTIFDDIATTVKRIKRVREKLEYIRMEADTPRSSVYSDMPKGGRNVGNPLEQYMIKQEELQERLTRLQARLEKEWMYAARLMNRAGVDKQTRKMMYLRFISGMQWEKCAAELDRLYPGNRWNVNKCFRRYRQVQCAVRHCGNRQTESDE